MPYVVCLVEMFKFIAETARKKDENIVLWTEPEYSGLLN